MEIIIPILFFAWIGFKIWRIVEHDERAREQKRAERAYKEALAERERYRY